MTAERMVRALDLASARDWDSARALLQTIDDPLARRLQAFVEQIERDEESRRRSAAAMRHEIGNALAIVQANLEGVIDGVLEASQERLAGMREALAAAGALLDGPRP